VKVVLLHAWPLDERMWDPHLAWVRDDGFDPVAPRLYGRGPSIDAWAGQILREVEGLFIAVGASMGGYTALALARRAPERVVGIVLAGSRGDADSAERRAYRDELVARIRAEGVPPDAETDASAEELAVAQEAIRDRPDASSVVGAFGGPLLVCVGDADEIVSVDEARELAEQALDGRLEVFPDAGHFVAVDQPERFNGVLLEFLSQWKT
jgi:3-oxoadipate enol-lactonase